MTVKSESILMKECPHCGSSKLYVRAQNGFRTDDYPFAIVSCGECFATAHSSGAETTGFSFEELKVAAITAWNRRI
jgi:Lar family restriction alleviation protein